MQLKSLGVFGPCNVYGLLSTEGIPNLEEPFQCMPAQSTYVTVGLYKDVQTPKLSEQ